MKYSPPADKKHVGAKLKPEQFTDLCLSKPVADYIDCFSRRSFYDQNVSRYFNISLSKMSSSIPRELLFLATLYASWNNENLTSAQFNEAEKKLEQFPSAALAKKIDNKNLISLRKKLFKLKIHSQLIVVLRQKYNISEKKGVQRSVKDEITYLNLPDAVQKNN